jgi:carbon-monoxide dehydrogenase large subunit
VCLAVPPRNREEHLFDDCEVVTTGTTVSQRLAPAPIEPRTTIAQLDDAGRLTIFVSTPTRTRTRWC